MISVICCWNKENQYTNLYTSVKKQDIECEIISIDNRGGNYKSAAEALNYGAGIANGDVFVFTHQDIILQSSDALRKFVGGGTTRC